MPPLSRETDRRIGIATRIVRVQVVEEMDAQCVAWIDLEQRTGLATAIGAKLQVVRRSPESGLNMVKSASL